VMPLCSLVSEYRGLQGLIIKSLVEKDILRKCKGETLTLGHVLCKECSTSGTPETTGRVVDLIRVQVESLDRQEGVTHLQIVVSHSAENVDAAYLEG